MLNKLIPAAQYLRMSTEHQQYSLKNQAHAIQSYAEEKGLEVLVTYSDAAKSGLDLKYRDGLRKLLNDVVSGHAEYKAILVYDVSRWGRFQDADESAHYEFICKQAGVRIHYCAEVFTNDDSVASALLKTLKRTMAGEYSRELSAKVFAGHKRLAAMGFKQGGMPGYGLRRMLVGPDGKPKGILHFGERKSLATDRVILVPGPRNEVRMVRAIFRWFIEEKLSLRDIAFRMNGLGIKFPNGNTWDHQNVRNVISLPKYTGIHVYGRRSMKLMSKSIPVNPEGWTVNQAAWKPIISSRTFSKAQERIASFTCNKTEAAMIQELRNLLNQHGKLTIQIVDKGECSSASAYRARFGSLRKAYDMAGYKPRRDFTTMDFAKTWGAVKASVLEQLLAILRASGQQRFIGSVHNHGFTFHKRPVLIMFARSVVVGGGEKWVRVRPKQLRECLQVLVRLGADQSTVLDFIVVPLASTDAGLRPFVPSSMPFANAEGCKTVADVAKALLDIFQ